MTTSSIDISTVTVKSAGTTLGDSFYDAMLEVEVVNDVHMPDVATIRLKLEDGLFAVVEDIPAEFDIGKEIQIDMEAWGDNTGTVFKGEVTSASIDLDTGGYLLGTVQATDKSHRMHRNMMRRTFLKKKISDIANTLAGEAGLSKEVDVTSHVYDYLIQAGESNWDFLKQLANRIGYSMFVSEGKLYFKKPDASLGDGPTLEWGNSLISFRSSVRSASQVSKVNVHGWDWKAQKEILGNASPPSSGKQGGWAKTGEAEAKQFGTSELDILTLPVADQSEAKTIAAGIASAVQGSFHYAEGESLGDPNIQPGKSIEIRGVGNKFSGKYFVTSVTHRFAEGGYTSAFIVSGSRANTMTSFLGGQAEPGGSHLMQGVVPAVVTNLEDPDNLARIKVSFPWMGADIESDWCRIAVPDAGNEKGFMFLPEVNDEVLVAFEHGDINRPFVIGSLWNGKQKPPETHSEAAKSGKVNHRIIKSRAGHMILLNDEDGKETIEITDKTGKNQILIDSSKNTLTVKIDKDITIEAGGKVDLKATGDLGIACQKFSVDAKGDAEIKGMNVKLTATSNVDVKGIAINLG